MEDKKLSDENLQKVSGGAVFPTCPEDGGGAVYNVDTAEGGSIVKPETDARFH